MNDLFADYDTSKMLNELGFDMECRDYYDENGELAKCVHYKDGLFISFKNSDELYTTAPLWQQIESWLWDEFEILVTYNVTHRKFIYYRVEDFSRNEGAKEIFYKDNQDSPITAHREGILKAIEYLHKNNNHKTKSQ